MSVRKKTNLLHEGKIRKIKIDIYEKNKINMIYVLNLIYSGSAATFIHCLNH